MIVDFPRGNEPRLSSEPYYEIARFEVQVRDVFEEAWSEAEHYLFYSQKDDFRELSEAEIEVFESAKKLVDIHRGTIDVTRTWISEIKTQLERTKERNAPNLQTKSTTSRLREHDSISVKKFRDSYKSIDNRMHGFVALGEQVEAVKLAKEIYGILQGYAAVRAGRSLEFHEIGLYLNTDERMNFNAAVNVVLSEGREWT